MKPDLLPGDEVFLKANTNVCTGPYEFGSPSLLALPARCTSSMQRCLVFAVLPENRLDARIGFVYGDGIGWMWLSVLTHHHVEENR